MSTSRSIVKTVYAEETPEGQGATVRRSIGTKNLRNLSPFLMLDHATVGKGASFPDHPHRGQATVTYNIQGESQHEDSAGHKGRLREGGVQWMCAGRGLIHAEMPTHIPGKPDPMGLQLWVDLPKKYKMAAPSYQELEPEQIPSVYPLGPDGGLQIKVISGKSHGAESPVRPLGGCWYFHFIFSKKGTVFQDLPAGWTAFLYCLKGLVKVANSAPQEPNNLLVLSANDQENGVSLTAEEDDTSFVLIAGEPLDQPIVQYGPFVMTSYEEIQQAISDYRLGRNGFEGAQTWRSSIGNL